MGRFLTHTACDNCGSRDGRAVYEGGDSYCYSCKAWEPPPDGGEEITKKEVKRVSKAFATGSYQDIPNRNLREGICQKFGYQVGTVEGKKCHIASYYRDGQLVAQKIRKPGKEFSVIGQGKDMPFFGQQLWGAGKSVVITEGEIDCLSVAQAFEGKWPVVSLPNGAQSAVKTVQAQYEWLDGFEKIVLCFDQDEPGQQAAQDVAAILPAGKAFIMRLPRKDANEVLVNDGTAPITQAFWNAKPWRPDGIVSVQELRETVLNPVVIPSLPYPWAGLNHKLGGLRLGELVTVTSGSGLGKSTLTREIAYSLLTQGQAVGGMFLEESNERTMLGLLSVHLSKNIVVDRSVVTKDELALAFDDLGGYPLYLWDHFGSNDIESVLSKVRYMARSLGVAWVILDHLSILISGLDVGDERRTIDIAMTKLRSLVQELGIGMVLVSHLKRPSGDKGHEDGAEVHLGQLRGSHSIAQLSDAVIGLQKDPEEPNGDTLEVVVLKNRFSGDRGVACQLHYSRDTGRLTESDL